MLVKLVKVEKAPSGMFSSLKEIYVNINHIASVTSENDTMSLVEKKSIGLIDNVELSRIVIVEGSRTRAITVVGEPADIYSKINRKQILRG